jgi:hypothetical protein
LQFLQADWFSRCGGTCRTTHEIDELNVAYNTKAGDSHCSLSSAKVGLNFDDVLEILGLVELLHKRKGSSNVLRRIAQKYSI